MAAPNFLGINPIRVLLAVLILSGLFLTSLHSYLLFHTLAELFSILIGGTIFILAWNFRRFFTDSFFVFLGTSYLFISLIDLAHTLVYKGMGIFQGYDANTPTQLWIAARFVQAISLLIAPLFLGRKVKVEWLVAGFTLVTSFLLLSIFVWGIFPDCYIEGYGLTPFKIISEYVIILILAVAIVQLHRKRSSIGQNLLRLLILSTLFTIAGELFFTFYIDVYGLMNLLGHFCKIIASYLIYKSIVVTAAVEIYTDMTRIRQAEAALRKSEERYRMLFNTMLNGFALHEIICNQEGEPIDYRFLEVNPAFERLTGLIGNEVVGKTVREVLPESEAYWIDTYGKVALKGEPIQFENYSAALEKHYQVFAFSPQKNRFATIFTDITGRKRAEAALEMYTQQLERSNRELEEFASIASHDLQEPLRKIENFGSLLRDSLGAKLGEPEADYLVRMQKAARRMRAMVNGLLALSRVTTKAQPFVRVNLNQIVKEVLDDLEYTIRETGGQVQTGDLPLITADPLQMHQLLLNLVGNGLKYHCPEVPPLVQISYRPVSSERVEISIQDNGIGFDMKYADRIFQMFQRLQGNSKYAGTGIGLAVCRKIVERHGGTITVYSAPGKGTTFFVTLPLQLQG